MCRTTSAQPLRVDESGGQTVHARPALPDTGRRRRLLIACSGSTVGKAWAHDEFGPACSRIKRLGVRQHRAIEFKKFLAKIDTAVPDDLDIRMVWTSAWSGQLRVNKSPIINAWLPTRPRFHKHFTPSSSSWINQVEPWFGFVTEQLVRCGSQSKVQALER